MKADCRSSRRITHASVKKPAPETSATLTWNHLGPATIVNAVLPWHNMPAYRRLDFRWTMSTHENFALSISLSNARRSSLSFFDAKATL